MKIDDIRHWRNCELLRGFFKISAASSMLAPTDVGTVIDVLLHRIDSLERELERRKKRSGILGFICNHKLRG